MTPFTTSLLPEAFFCVGRGVDKSTGRRFVLAARNKSDLATTWRMEWTTNRNGRSDWRCVGHSTSQGESVTYPSPRNLSHSHIDTALRSMCAAGEWVGTEWRPA